MSNNDNLQPIQNLKPFTRFCCSIGAIPTSYLVSLSYEEQLLWLCDYLENTIIPTVNNNGDAITELQQLYTQLKSYVDNYFTNLDVQEEINNKLDAMAEDGTLNTIINQEIFNQLYTETMTNTENITKNTEDITKNTNDINNLENDVNSLLESKERYVLMIGDSYANRTNSWQDRIASYAKLDNNHCVKRKASGTGFCNTIGGVSFISMLEDIPIENNKITDIIVCGGYNDSGYSTDLIYNALSAFINRATTLYPNAHIYIGMISWAISNTDIPNTIFDNLSKVRDAYTRASYWSDKAHYLNNVEYTLHNMNFIDDSYFHPNDLGQLYLALNIMRAWITGSTNVNYLNTSITNIILEENLTLSSSSKLYQILNNFSSRMFAQNKFKINFDKNTIYNLSDNLLIGTIQNQGYIQGLNYITKCSVSALIHTMNNGYFLIPATLLISNQQLILNLRALNRQGTNWLSDSLDYIELNGINLLCDSMLQY